MRSSTSKGFSSTPLKQITCQLNTQRTQGLSMMQTLDSIIRGVASERARDIT